MVNDLGVDPYEWFETKYTNPLDSMPIATDTPLSTNRYAPPEKMIQLEQNPRPEEDVADWFDTAPCSMEPQEETIHHKMYEIATSKYNPFAVGGSESIRDVGGSEQIQSK